MTTQRTTVTLEYGLGKACLAELEEPVLETASVRELITMVVDSPQETKPAERTAKMISSAIQNRRPLDVEVVKGNQKNSESGVPVELDEPVINHEENGSKIDTLTVRVSEAYVGGYLAAG